MNAYDIISNIQFFTLSVRYLGLECKTCVKDNELKSYR